MPEHTALSALPQEPVLEIDAFQKSEAAVKDAIAFGDTRVLAEAVLLLIGELRPLLARIAVR